MEKIQLQKVFCHNWWELDDSGIDEIYIMQDGHGTGGMYDRVHIIRSGEWEGNLIVPAHHCEIMEKLFVKEVKS